MVTESLSFFSRLLLGLVLPFRLLVDGQLAAQVARLTREGSLALGGDASERVRQLEAEVSSLQQRTTTGEPAAQGAAKTAPAVDAHAAALQVLAILQRDGRLVDFLSEDVASFTDAEVGAAARLVHDGCKKVLKQYFTVEPVRKEEEGARITVEKGFDPSEIRLTGNVSGDPPYQGALAHPGWRVTHINLPRPAKDSDLNVIAPAEVEL